MLDYNYPQNTNNDNNNSKCLRAATNKNFFTAYAACLLFIALLLHVFIAIHSPLHLVTIMSHTASYPIPHTRTLDPLFASNSLPLISAVVALSHHFLCYLFMFVYVRDSRLPQTLAGVQSKRNRRCRPKRSSATGVWGARPTAPRRSWGGSCDL